MNNDSFLNSQQLEKTYLDMALMTVFSDVYLDIYEVTYAYTTLPNGNYLNTTLFGKLIFGDTYLSELANLELTSQEIQNLVQLAEIKIIQAQESISTILNGLKGLPSISSHGQLLISTLEEKADILKMTQLGLPFEAEKAGLILSLDQEEVTSNISQIITHDTAVFGSQVIEVPQEHKASIARCKKTISEKGSTLSVPEMEEFLALCEISPQWHTIDVKQEKSDEFLSESILDIPVPRDNYIQIFQITFEIYGLKIPIREDERSSIYDGEDALYIPLGEKYDFLSVRKILSLIAHEIETHYIIAHNNHSTLGFRSAGNIFRDEGLAIIMEYSLYDRDISRIPISENMIFIMYGEILTGIQFHRFLELYFKMIGHYGHEEKFRRSKRNYSRHMRGVQHKDTTYSRGKTQVQNYLQSGRNPKDLFKGKIGLSDLEMIDISTNSLIYPFGVAHILQFFLLGGKELDLMPFLNELHRDFGFFNGDMQKLKSIQAHIQRILELILKK